MKSVVIKRDVLRIRWGVAVAAFAVGANLWAAGDAAPELLEDVTVLPLK